MSAGGESGKFTAFVILAAGAVYIANKYSDRVAEEVSQTGQVVSDASREEYYEHVLEAHRGGAGSEWWDPSHVYTESEVNEAAVFVVDHHSAANAEDYDYAVRLLIPRIERNPDAYERYTKQQVMGYALNNAEDFVDAGLITIVCRFIVNNPTMFSDEQVAKARHIQESGVEVIPGIKPPEPTDEQVTHLIDIYYHYNGDTQEYWDACYVIVSWPAHFHPNTVFNAQQYLNTHPTRPN